jgi:hypothetical protein
MSEIFIARGFKPTVFVIGFSDGTAIGVSAPTAASGPLTCFCHLKQSRHCEVKLLVDYFIDRKVENAHGNSRVMVPVTIRRTICTFIWCRSAEEEYIFNWLAWTETTSWQAVPSPTTDQFDSSPPNMTNIVSKTSPLFSIAAGTTRRTFVQVFAQAMAFIKSGTKENLKTSKDAERLKVFD